MKITLKRLLVTALAVFLVAPMAVSAAGNKQLMTIQKSRDLARRAIVESVVGLKIRSNALWASRPSDYYTIESKVAAAIKGVKFDRIQYDKEKDIAKATAYIQLGSVVNIIGKQVDFQDQVIRRTAFATSTPTYMPQLNALRAAELNAYDEMAKLIVGQKIKSETRVKNFVLENDKVRTKTLAAIWGSEVKEFGWTEDGNAFVTLRLNARWVQDIVGQRIEYTEDNYVEATGYGSPVDDYSGTAGTGGSTERLVTRPSAVEATSFDIPSTAQGEIKAAPTSMPPTRGPDTGGSQLYQGPLVR